MHGELIIAGKEHSEILSMKNWNRTYWYTKILLEEKEEAMKLVAIVGWAKNRAAHIGGVATEETKAKQRAAWTPERKAKASLALTERMKDPKTKAKHKAVLTGRIVSKEQKVNMSTAAIERWRSSEYRRNQSMGVIEKWKDPDHRQKHSDSIKGENNPSWQGGISFEPYGVDFNAELKRQIRSRDNHTCQECLRTEEQLYCALDVHHIDYCKTNNNSENLIALCRSCHAKTNFDREDWSEYFRTRVPSFSQIGGRR